MKTKFTAIVFCTAFLSSSMALAQTATTSTTGSTTTPVVATTSSTLTPVRTTSGGRITASTSPWKNAEAFEDGRQPGRAHWHHGHHRGWHHQMHHSELTRAHFEHHDFDHHSVSHASSPITLGSGSTVASTSTRFTPHVHSASTPTSVNARPVATHSYVHNTAMSPNTTAAAATATATATPTHLAMAHQH